MNLRTEHGRLCSGETFILVDSPMPVKTGTVGRSLGDIFPGGYRARVPVQFVHG